MERVQTERRTTQRGRRSGEPVLGISSQGARLSNGRYFASITAMGGGRSECGGFTVTRFTPDPTTSSEGFHVLLRDLEEGTIWSAGFQPTRVQPDAYEFSFSAALAEIARTDGDIDCRMTVCVAPEHDMELRRCRVTNRGTRSRHIELTSYLEFVLGSREADAHHPTFSKLFIETDYRAGEAAIVARRRPRGADEPERWGFHRLLTEANWPLNSLEFETSRTAFLGRGRTIDQARAFDRGFHLSGVSGPVLDPIGSLRLAITLKPGESREVVFLLGAATSGEAIESLIAAVDDYSSSQVIFAAAEDLAAAANGETSRWIAHPPHDSLDSRLREAEPRRLFVPVSSIVSDSERRPQTHQEPLHFENSFGGFSADGREYVIRLDPDQEGHLRLPPQPWVNVLANERAGCLVTERGAGYTWVGNSRHNRLTAWHNDPVCDPHAEAIWIRDEEAEVFWSPMPGPTPAEAPYEVRHGFGYTTFHHASLGLVQEVTVFMAPDDPVKLVRLRLKNMGRSRRRLSVFSYLQWSLSTLIEENDSVVTEFDDRLQAILARNAQREVYAGSVAFSACVVNEEAAANVAHSGDREAFLGREGSLASPAAVAEQERLNNRTGGELDPCAAWQLSMDVPAGGNWECTFLLGETDNPAVAGALIRKYRTSGRVQQSLDETIATWQKTLAAVQIETPDREIDLMVNGWLPYQVLACRMWARSAYYQPGGAFGFRDQLQDAAALVYHRPDLTRQQILRHASQQFLEGDVMHWWHADSGIGLRTRFSDDLVWLPYVTAGYVLSTGDTQVLDEVVPFLCGELLGEGHAEALLQAELSGDSGSIYEHCCRALDRAITAGPHGLPLIGSGDWNDGFSRVGLQGRGESVWLGFFLHVVLGDFIPICADRNDHQRADRYGKERERLAHVLNTDGWDGDWYRRAYYDNGQPLGSAENDECRIDALAQAWAVLSGVAPPERATLALEAVEEQLVDEHAGLIRLLTPPFDKTANDPGYIKGYLRGIRENGGQYTHGVLWFVRALAESGRGTRAVDLLSMLSPVTHTATSERAHVYQTEPYVVAADVYSEPPHAGRGGWTWYTGSAGWMLRVAVESILGLSVEGGQTLVLKPAISSDWPRCRLHYRLPDGKTQYQVTIENPNRKETGVTAATVDGRPASVDRGAARVPLVCDGELHQVTVWL